MKTTKVLTDILFEPGQGFDPRAGLVLSDPSKIRLDPADHRIKLKVTPSFYYPTDQNLSARSRLYRPAALRQLLMVQACGVFPEGTSIGYRLFDGTTERWWNGSAWAVAGAGNWNTETELNAHIATYSAAARQFAVTFNLATTDPNVTPELQGLRVLWEGPIDWHDDILIDSLLGEYLAGLNFVCDASLPPLDAITTTVDLDDYLQRSTLDVVDLDAVFNDTLDPQHATNILGSYNAGTKLLTLSGSVAVGTRLFLRLLVRPSVSWSTHQDFEEVGKVPAVILSETKTVKSTGGPIWGEAGIVRKDTGAAWTIPAPARLSFAIIAELRTSSLRELSRLHSAILERLEDGPMSGGPFLRSVATDRRFRVWTIDEYQTVTAPENSSDLRVAQLTIRIEDVTAQTRPARAANGVLTLNLGFHRIDSANLDGGPTPTTPLETVKISGG